MVFKSFYNRFRSFFLYHLMLFVNYILFLSAVSNELMYLNSVVLVLLSYILIGIGGYLLNDYYDQKNDLKAGKTSTMNYLSPSSFKVVLFFCWFIGFILISYLSLLAGFVILLQLALLIMYSHPSLRLKERGGLGIVVDSLYAYVVPVIIILIVGEYTIEKWSVVIFIMFNLFVGIRDILIHQNSDRAADISSDVKTFMIVHEKLGFKIIYFSDIVALLSITCLFLIVLEWKSILYFSLLILVIKMVYSFKQCIECNCLVQYYVFVSSCFIGYWLLKNGSYFWIFLLLHPFNILQVKRFFSLIRKVLSPMINYPLYYIALKFGRDLRKDPLKW